MTALNAKDVRFSNVLWKGSQVQPPSPTNSPLKSGNDPSGRFRPDKNATGPHTVFKRYEDGKIRKYETYRPQTNIYNPNPWESVKRFDNVNGDAHFNKSLREDIFAPHVHDNTFPGGVRPAQVWEIPK